MASWCRRVAWLANALRRRLVITILIVVILGQVTPSIVLAYKESAVEISVGNVLFQNQSYTTANKQTLFHTDSATDVDDESFFLGRTPQGGISLAQTSNGAETAQQTGFFSSSSSSDVVLPVPLSQGFMGTFISDPIGLNQAPLGSGLIFPQMSMEDTNGAGQGIGNLPATSDATTNKTNALDNATGNTTLKNETAPGNSPINSSDDIIQKNLTTSQPNINYDLKSATGANQTSGSDPGAQSNAGRIESRQESPGQRTSPEPVTIKPNDPLGHQTNKPFTQSMGTVSGPLKASRDLVQNMSSWDRFIMNTVGRSTTDKSFNGTVSRPTDFRPGKAMAPIVTFEFISGGLNMTRPGSQLSNRQWPL